MAARLCSTMMTACACILAACSESSAPAPASEVADAGATGAAAVSTARLTGASGEPDNWLTHGRTYSEQRFSPLAQIDSGNVERLNLAWYFDLDTNRGQQSTPLIVDGVMYVTTAWSKIKSLDAATGELLWEYDPQVPGAAAIYACCDLVNRGAAIWNDKVYFATIDGRLVALEAATGEPVWETMTIDAAMPYTISGAPRVVKGNVVIGNSGGEFGVRGYVTAYDGETGELAWRFYTVPNPDGAADGAASDEALRDLAQPTWSRDGMWRTVGGGGTVWDTIVYDPVTDLVYLGVGNGSPWVRSMRSPGGGDNLFLGSIVAVDADTGEYVWHYQETPGETWDFTSSQPLMTADLRIDGRDRHVILHAPKNGFFYVLDAATGELISADKFTRVDWATHVDLQTGRPVENPAARYDETGEPFTSVTGPQGARNWSPWSFNPDTGLVYMSVQSVPFIYAVQEGFAPTRKGTNTGVDMELLEPPADPAVMDAMVRTFSGALVAWDPVRRQARWRVEHSGPWNGGTLTTAGKLVVQGLPTGEVVAFGADDGRRLWSFDAQTGVLPGPVSYSVDGEQYLAVVVGWGGGQQIGMSRRVADVLGYAQQNVSRVLAFKLDGQAALPDPPPEPLPGELNPPPVTASQESLARGKTLYARHCVSCHGAAARAGSLIPDLRYSQWLDNEGWFAVVRDGSLEPNGMVAFGDVLSRDDVTDIRNYVILRAHDPAPPELRN